MCFYDSEGLCSKLIICDQNPNFISWLLPKIRCNQIDCITCIRKSTANYENKDDEESRCGLKRQLFDNQYGKLHQKGK